LKGQALNALTIVSELGDGTAFITATTNVNWPEIVEKLLPGQTAFEDPMLVAYVFKARLSKLLNNIRYKLFGALLIYNIKSNPLL
jgi:hypothetical protein